MNRKEIKDMIEKYEYNINGFGRLNGRDVKVVNLRVTKEKVICDVILINDDDNMTERYNNTEYKLSKLVELANKNKENKRDA